MAFDALPAAAPSARGLVDARARLGVALLLGFGFAAVDGVAALPAMLAVAAAAAALSGAALRDLARPLRAAGPVMLAILIVTPLAVGETPLATLGPLTLRAEGAAAALLVGGRFLCIVVVAAAMLGPVPRPALIRGLRGLGLPALMADLALLMLRYLDEVRGEAARMRTAMALRGRPPDWRRLGETGWLLAALLLRAHARADRQWQAMRARGHGAPAVEAPPPALRGRDRLALGAAAAVALAFAFA